MIRQRVDGAVRSMVVSHLRDGSPYRFQVRAINSIGNGPRSARSVAVRPGTPLAPRVGSALSGTAGGKVSATARWRAPRANGTASITGYRVTARPLGTARSVTRAVPASAPALDVTGLVRNAAYQFTVTAVNANGRSAGSARSNRIVAR